MNMFLKDNISYSYLQMARFCQWLQFPSFSSDALECAPLPHGRLPLCGVAGRMQNRPNRVRELVHTRLWSRCPPFGAETLRDRAHRWRLCSRKTNLHVRGLWLQWISFRFLNDQARLAAAVEIRGLRSCFEISSAHERRWKTKQNRWWVLFWWILPKSSEKHKLTRM